MQSSPAEVYEYPTPPPGPNQRQHLLWECDEETSLDAFLDQSDGFRESFEQPWATAPAIQRIEVSLASLQLCFQAPSITCPIADATALPNYMLILVAGSRRCMQRVIVPVGRS